MDPKNILVVGIKGSLLAFHRDTGVKLWSTHLKGSDFVSVATDEKRIYAHTRGELFCVELLTGNPLWSDGLKGLGYDIASLAGLGLSVPAPAPSAIAERYRQQAASSAATTT